MKSRSNKIKVHQFLHELFGREATRLDLLFIILSAVFFAGLTLILQWNSDISAFKVIILSLLALDIGGGVVANFTTGTNNYYAESVTKRYFFIFFHLLQPSILIWIFPDKILAIVGITAFTLVSSIIILNIKKHYTQKIVAVTLLLLCLVLATLLIHSQPALQILMHLYSIKLVLAFSVNWASINGDETNTENQR